MLAVGAGPAALLPVAASTRSAWSPCTVRKSCAGALALAPCGNWRAAGGGPRAGGGGAGAPGGRRGGGVGGGGGRRVEHGVQREGDRGRVGEGADAQLDEVGGVLRVALLVGR